MENGYICQSKPDSGVKGGFIEGDPTIAAQSETLPIKGAALPPGISFHALTPEDEKDIAGRVEDMIHARASLSEHWPPYTASPISAAVNLAKAKGEIKARTVERDLGGSKNIDASPIDAAATLTDVALLPAGKELDSLIAERVMGWKQTAPEVFCYEFEPGRGVPRWTGRGDDNPNPVNRYRPFRPSEDIRDAWQVVEQLKQRRYTRITIGLQGLGNTVDFCHMEGDYPACYEVIDGHGHDAFSLPLAICRGALGCVG